MMGTLIQISGLLISTQTRTPWLYILTYGWVAGLGQSLTYFQASVATGLYFNERRALAAGKITFLYPTKCLLVSLHDIYLVGTYFSRSCFRRISFGSQHFPFYHGDGEFQVWL